MVNPDPDGRGWTGDAAEEPWRRGQRHPPARSHDRHRIQLSPRPTTALSRMMALGADQMGVTWMVCEKHEQAGHKGHHEFTRVVGYAREASPRRRSTSSGLRRSKSRWAGFLRWDEPSQ